MTLAISLTSQEPSLCWLVSRELVSNLLLSQSLLGSRAPGDFGGAATAQERGRPLFAHRSELTQLKHGQTANSRRTQLQRGAYAADDPKMSLQAAVISNTIASMKKAVTRRDDASDSDDLISQPTNRGNKLKRKARYVREGQLDLPSGPRVYKRKIEHAGYARSTISRNPRRYDGHGNELEDEEIDEEADASAAAENPYGDIRLEHTLAPLTSATELTTHPALSQPYLSNILTKMAEQAANMVHQERATLWRTKELLTKFRDETWIPCGAVETDHDIHFFGPLPTGGERGSPVALEEPTATDPEPNAEVEAEGELEAETQPMAIDEPEPSTETAADADKPETHDRPEVARDSEPKDADPPSEAKPPAAEMSVDEGQPAGDTVVADPPKDTADDVPTNADALNPTQSDANTANEAGPSLPSTQTEQPIPDINGDSTAVIEHAPPATNGVHPAPSAETATAEPTVTGSPADPAVNTNVAPNAPPTPTPSPSPPPAHRMTTRARLNPPVPSLRPSPTPPPTTIQIHPLFLAPATSLPDPDFGLPPAEAEETRRLLLSYVQKQEEVCRGAERLYAGLLRADRMRHNVWEWARQAGHEGEMSDGEDWVDGRRWGLDDGEGVGGAAGLKKGVDEEEGEEAGGTGGAKRTRRRGV